MAKKKKDPTAYEIALDAFRVPVRGIDETIQDWDRIAETVVPELNWPCRIASIAVLYDPALAQHVAETVMSHYSPRFTKYHIRTVCSCYDGKPFQTQFVFEQSRI